MGALDQQVMFGAESTYGLLATPSRAYEFNNESIEDSFARTEGDPLRVGTYVRRSDRFTPYYEQGAGSVEFDVMTKGFGFLLGHMLGSVVTAGPTETSVYTHTATMTDLFGKSLTCQVGRPFHPSGTVQPFTYRGGKITEWELSNSVGDNLVLSCSFDFQQVDTTTPLATAAYPAGMENLTWAGGTITVGGVQAELTEFSVQGNNGLNTDRRYIRGNTDKKEPVGGRREVTFSLEADFDSLAHRTRAAATSGAGATAAIVAKWEGPTLLGTTIKPSLQINIPAARFDEWSAANEGPEGIMQSLSGVGLYDGSSSPVSAVYRSADAVA